MGSTRYFCAPPTTRRLRKSLLLTLVLALGSTLTCPFLSASSVVPDDIAYKPKPATIETPPLTGGDVMVGTAEIPPAASSTATGAPDTATQENSSINKPVAAKESTRYMPSNLCPDHSGHFVNLQKSLAITRFLRNIPASANAGKLFAAESEVPALIRSHINTDYQTLSPEVLAFGFAPTQLTDAQLKQQAQKIARQTRTQFVLSGAIDDMAMTYPSTTYNPNAYRQVANLFHDVTRVKMFDKRTRVMNLSVQLRDGFTGEILFNKEYSTSGIWNTRSATGFGSPAFYQTHYGKQVIELTQKISKEIAQVIHCQPFMARIDSQPGQTQILLHGGANNGLHAGDTLSLYQVVIAGSNTEYQVNETRLVKRDTRLHLSEVYPSHSIAQVEGGSYLNGHYLAVGE
ncbi:MAG TPA: flagella assembly protein FlgT middle domain-containing protein [Cellvibrio sp.]|nr:flagella assembly protein FlgT middle domain-containing protein [Cellvibrio sp.]